MGPVEIIIVNNTNTALSERFLEFDFIKEVFIGKNIGFGSAANRGAKEAKGEFLFFLNPDAKILLADTFERILTRLQEEKHEEVGVVGGGLIGAKYTRESWGGGKAGTLKDILLKRLFFSIKGDSFKKNEAMYTDWVSGAAFCVRREDFFSFQGFDEGFFLYFEDVDFCLRIGKKKAILYDGSVHILHYGGKSFSERKEQKKQYYLSQKRYFRKHRPNWENTVLDWLQKILLKDF